MSCSKVYCYERTRKYTKSSNSKWLLAVLFLMVSVDYIFFILYAETCALTLYLKNNSTYKFTSILHLEKMYSAYTYTSRSYLFNYFFIKLHNKPRSELKNNSYNKNILLPSLFTTCVMINTRTNIFKSPPYICLRTHNTYMYTGVLVYLINGCMFGHV